MLHEWQIKELQDEFTTSVRMGVRLLDRHFGGGEWRNTIDHSILDLHHIYNCVLGQVFGSYTTGRLTLDVDEEEFGFCADEASERYENGSISEVYSILTSTWNDEADGYEYEGMPLVA